MGKELCCSGHIKVQNFRNQLDFQPTPHFFIYAEMRHTVFVIQRPGGQSADVTRIMSQHSVDGIHIALPVFCVSLHGFEALTMKGGSMLSANDFPAVWILALVAYAVGFRSGTAFLEYLICLIPKFFRYNRRDIRVWVCYPLAFIKKCRFFFR